MRIRPFSYCLVRVFFRYAFFFSFCVMSTNASIKKIKMTKKQQKIYLLFANVRNKHANAHSVVSGKLFRWCYVKRDVLGYVRWKMIKSLILLSFHIFRFTFSSLFCFILVFIIGGQKWKWTTHMKKIYRLKLFKCFAIIVSLLAYKLHANRTCFNLYPNTLHLFRNWTVCCLRVCVRVIGSVAYTDNWPRWSSFFPLQDDIYWQFE